MMDSQKETWRHHRKKAEKAKGKFFKIRNILNTLFIIGAVAGLLLYYISDHTVGIVVILSSMVFKLAECCLRFSRQ